MKIYQHCESDKRLWLNMLKNIEILKIHLSQTRFVIQFSANPKNMRVKLRHFMMFSLTFPSIMKLCIQRVASPSSFVFALVQYLPCAASTYKISSSAADIWTYSSMEKFFTFHFLLLPPWLRHVSGNFSRQDRKFHNGCLSAGNPRLNFYNYFCKAWCNVLKW